MCEARTIPRKARRSVAALACLVGISLAAAFPSAAFAQTKPATPAPVTATPPKPTAPVATKPLGYAPTPSAVPPTVTPMIAPSTQATTAPTPATPPQTPQPTILKLRAVVTEDGQPIKAGLVWRIFSETSALDGDARMKLVATSAGGDAEFKLDQGSYIVHAAYGRAAATTKVELTKPMRSETLILNAGGIKLSALLSGDIAIPPEKLTFDIYSKEADSHGERQALVVGAAANKVIRLNADTYHVVSHYGTVNATVRAELHVTPGKLTEATVYHKAAEITLKLVADVGGEAMTNVNWLILTPSGDQIYETEGSFPSMVLAEGEYAVVAKHQEQVFTRNFSVEAGYNREIELQATKPIDKTVK